MEKTICPCGNTIEYEKDELKIKNKDNLSFQEIKRLNEIKSVKCRCGLKIDIQLSLVL